MGRVPFVGGAPFPLHNMRVQPCLVWRDGPFSPVWGRAFVMVWAGRGAIRHLRAECDFWGLTERRSWGLDLSSWGGGAGVEEGRLVAAPAAPLGPSAEWNPPIRMKPRMDGAPD